jgi:hypothetical protein
MRRRPYSIDLMAALPAFVRTKRRAVTSGTPLRTRGWVPAIVAPLAAVLVVALTTDPAGAVVQSNACTNSVTADATQIDVTLTATAPASVSAGASVQLTSISQSLSLPGFTFVAGYNVGLLQEGVNTIPGSVRTVIEGSNTVQGTQMTPSTSVAVTTTINDPDNVPGTGDETATAVAVVVSYPNQTWTAGASGTIQFREDTVPLAANSGGVLVNLTIGGFLNVQFRCSPGTVTPPDPGVVSLIDPAASFATTQIGSSATTTTSPVPPTTTTTTQPAPPRNTCDAGKLKCMRNKAACILKVHEKARKTGTVPDGAKIAACQLKFDDPAKGCVAKVEAKQTADKPETICSVPGNTALLEGIVDAYVTDALAGIGP